MYIHYIYIPWLKIIKAVIFNLCLHKLANAPPPPPFPAAMNVVVN